VIEPRSIAVGNLNGDTIPDLAVVGDVGLLVFLGEGLECFGSPVLPIVLDPDWFHLDVRWATSMLAANKTLRPGCYCSTRFGLG